MLGLLMAASVLPAAESDVEVIQGFTVPDYDREGRLKSELTGDRAEILPDHRVRVINLTIKFYSKGEVTMTVNSPECVYDRRRKVVESEAPVRISLKNMVVTGRGFRWSQGRERLEIFHSSRVVLKGVRSDVITKGKKP